MNHSVNRMLTCSILSSALLHLGALAQTPPSPPADPPPVVLKSTTRLIQVSVIAQQKGEPVADLTKDDFVLTDNGKPQAVRVFSVESSGSLPRPAQSLPPNQFTNRVDARAGTPSSVTIILLDTLNTKFSDQAYAREQVTKFLQTIQPDDHIGIYALGGTLRVLHDYTTDSRELLRRLSSNGGKAIPDLARTEPAVTMDSALLDTWLRGGGASGIERDFYTINRVQGTLRAIRFIADHLARVPGRKNLIWVSGGFPLTLGFENIAQFNNPAREHVIFNDEITQAVRAMNSANLAIYPVDARGLMVDPRFSAANPGPAINPRALATMPPAPVGVRNQETMRELADRTGGRAYYNTNGITKAIRDAVEDARVTYTLGYYPTEDKLDGKFHTIKVKVSRSGVNLRYRKGYFDLPEQPQDDRARKLQLRDAVYSPLDATELGLTVQVALIPAMASGSNAASSNPSGSKAPPANSPFPQRPEAPGTKSNPALTGSVAMVVRVDPEGLNLQKGANRWAGRLDVLFVQKDAQGRQYEGQDDTINMELKEETYQAMIQKGLIYTKKFARNPRADRVRVVIRDAASGAIGSVTVFFKDIVKT